MDAQRKRRLEKGLPISSNTEQEDEEEDRELEEDVEPEDGDEHPSRPRSRRPNKQRRAAHNKGKEKASDKGKEKAPLKPGPLSDLARKEAQELGDEITQSATNIANRHCTTVRNILIAAGFGIKESRAPNIFNKHAEWYSYHFPKDPKGTPSSI